MIAADGRIRTRHSSLNICGTGIRMKYLFASLLAFGVLCGSVRAADAPTPPAKPAAKPAAKQPALPTPTLTDVAYGPHPKQVLNFWKAESDKPTPLLFFIHG